MKLTVWTYEGPPHVGAMRVATGMKGLHYVLHAPQGDTYADLLFTMIERRDHRPPVTYTTFQARDLGADTANLFKTACQDAYDRFQPEALIVGASCTAELIQDDPGGMAETMGLPVPVIPLELPSYQRKENFGADETFFQIVKALAKPIDRSAQISCNLIGVTGLGFRIAMILPKSAGCFLIWASALMLWRPWAQARLILSALARRISTC